MGALGSTNSTTSIATTADLGAYVPLSVVDAAADLIVGTGNDTVGRLAKGSDGQVLTVDPTTHLLVWATPAGGAPSGAAGGDLSGTYPNPSVVDDSHAHTSSTVTPAGIGAATTSTKLDDFATPDDNTDLNATTSQHGLLPKLGGGGTNYLRADGTWAAPSGSGAPASVDYLVGTADAGLSGEIVVGTTPNGELGGTWGAITVDATHSGSAHITEHTHAAAGQGATGGGDTLNPVRMKLPASMNTTEGQVDWDTTNKAVEAYDSQRERAVSSVGWVPYVFMPNFVSTAALTTSVALAAAGGSIAIPFYVPGHMLFQRMLIRQRDTTLLRTAEARLYVQRLNNGNGGENTLDFVTGTDGTLSFTAAAVSTQQIAASAAPVYLAPGVYWYVLRNTHATNAFNIATTAVSAELANNVAQTKTLGSGLGSTLDFVAATWAKTTYMVAIRLDGRVFGQTTQF